jgi:protein ImuB
MTRGPSRYFGGDEALAAHVHEAGSLALGEADPGARPVMFGWASPTGASQPGSRRVGHGPARRSWSNRQSAAFCAPWPVAVFDDEALESLLVRLGLRTLGDVAALPADAVLARFGFDGRPLPRSRARDRLPARPVLVTPPPDLVEQVELDPPVHAVGRGRVRGEGSCRPLARPARRSRARLHARR